MTAQSNGDSQTNKNNEDKRQLKSRASPTASKKTYEGLWKAIFFGVVICSFYLWKRIYMFHTSPHFQNVPQGSISDLVKYALPFGIVFAFIDQTIHYVFDPICDKYYINQQKYPEKQYRMKRCYTLVKWAYSLVFYAFSSVFAFSILKNAKVFPWWVFGDGECSNIYGNVPYITQFIPQIKTLYMIQLGKHLARACLHMFVRAEGNYYEYALHHMLSLSLIFFSYMMNFWMAGVMVLFLHDISDVFLIMIRAYMDFKHRTPLPAAILSSMLFVVWVMTRIVLFTACCIYAAIQGALTTMYQNYTEEQIEVIWFPAWFIIFMLCCLQVMQLFWTYYIANSSASMAISQKVAKHTYD